MIAKLLYWLRRLTCRHDWRCCNKDSDMFSVNESTVRFRCRKCGKEEGL